MTQTIQQVKKTALIRIVDDDEAHCDAMKFMLESRGWRVKCFDSAELFLVNDVASVPGCLILDVHMPKMSGLELQNRLKETHAQIPVIFLTGYGDVDMAVHAMHEGAADFFQKPVKTERLVAAVEKAAHASVTLLLPFLLMTQEQARAKLAVLSPREVQVAKLAALKLSSPVIGERLGISERTAEAHMSSAFKKLGLHASGELAELLEIAEI